MSKFKGVAVNLVILILSPALVLGALELGFRTFASHRVKTYFEQQAELVLGNPPAAKKPGEYRMFIFGGSSAYGFPVADRYSIAAWLRKSSSHLFPGKTVSVMNFAWPGKGSYHSREGAHTALKYKPDLFIVYCGHNDAPIDNRLFTDNWFYRLDLMLRFRSVFYRFLYSRAERVRKQIVYGKAGYSEKQYREEAIAIRAYRKTEADDEEYAKIAEHFKDNVQDIIRTARRHGAKVVLVTPPSNLRDIPPAMSLHRKGLTAAEKSEWERYYAVGKHEEEAGDVDKAFGLYEKAVVIDPHYADLQYRLGRLYEKRGLYAEAKEAFTKARDLDAYPTRAKTVFSDILKELAKQDGVMLVDAAALLEKISDHGIISSKLIYDNVHPTVQTQQIMTDEILRVLSSQGEIASKSEWRWSDLEKSKLDPANDEWKVDGSVNAYGFVLRGLHLWEQQRYEEAMVDLEKGIKAMPGFYESYAFLGDAYYRRGKKEQAIQAFEILAQKDPALLKLLAGKYDEIRQAWQSLFPGKQI